MSDRIVAYKIAAARDGYRRAGRGWSVEAQTVSAEDLSEEQLSALRADKNIIIAEITLRGEEKPAVGSLGEDRSKWLLLAEAVGLGEDATEDEIREAAALVGQWAGLLAGSGPDDLLVGAIALLPPPAEEGQDDPNWTQAGLPETRSLSRLMGTTVTAAQRDAAWARLRVQAGAD